MCEGQGLDQGVGDAGRLVVGEGVTLDLLEELLERHAVHVFHDQVGMGAVVGEVDDLHDIGVLQHAGRSRLGERGGGGFERGSRVGRCQGHALDGHASLQAGVEADLDAAKAARGARLERSIALEQGRRCRAGGGRRSDGGSAPVRDPGCKRAGPGWLRGPGWARGVGRSGGAIGGCGPAPHGARCQARAARAIGLRGHFPLLRVGYVEGEDRHGHPRAFKVRFRPKPSAVWAHFTTVAVCAVFIDRRRCASVRVGAADVGPRETL